MQVTLAGTAIWHLRRRDQRHADRIARRVHRAWRLHADHCASLARDRLLPGIGPASRALPSRYATVFAFCLEGLDAASERLQNFVREGGAGTLVGDLFDDAATGQGLPELFLRALNCGASPSGSGCEERPDARRASKPIVCEHLETPLEPLVLDRTITSVRLSARRARVQLP